MKKLIVLSMLMFLVSFGISQARSNVAPAPIRHIDVEAMDEGSTVEPIVEETTAPSTGGNFIILLAGQCKTVEYTEWSACNKNFGSKGFQFRDIIRPTLGNCLPTGIQQAETVRDCQ